MSSENKTYGASQITYLKNLEPVRKRPGMYIGGEDQAIKQMLWEVVDNSVDEYLAGHNKTIDITIDAETRTFTIKDYGRGIPIEMHPVEQISTIELVLTKLHAGGKFGQSGYKFSGGLHGVGVSAVNALSKLLYAEVERDGKRWGIEFSEGRVTKDLFYIGDTSASSTKIVFIPDDTVLPNATMPEEMIIADRLKEIAMLNIGLRINLNYNNNITTFYEDNFKNVMKYYATDLILDNIYVANKSENFELDVIFNWSKTKDTFACFTNGIRQAEGGDHLRGAYGAISDVVLKYVQEYQNKINRKTPVVKSEDVKQNLCIIISLKMIDPRFTSQTKEKLSSLEARNYVKDIVAKSFGDYVEKNPQVCKVIITQAIANASAREDATKDKVVIKGAGSLPAQLAVCTSKNPEECELFIVEGDGAGGSARMGRDRSIQAVLPINGKLLNIMRASHQKIYNSASVKALMASIGLDYNKEFNIAKLKYHKIIMLTDADTDGLHILTLLLIFFIQTRPEIVSGGFIYIVYPPLYKVIIDKKSIYAQDNEQLYNIMYTKFANNYPLQQNGVNMTSVEIKQLFFELNEYYTSCRNKNLHIDADLILLLSFYDIRTLETLLNCTIIIEREDETEIILICESIYGTNRYAITKVPHNVNIDHITYKDESFKHIYELYNFILSHRNKGISVTRFKGLGEMNFEELEETCLNIKNRKLIQVAIDPENYDQTIADCRLIMDNSQERIEFLRKALGIDISIDESLLNEEEDISDF